MIVRENSDGIGDGICGGISDRMSDGMSDGISVGTECPAENDKAKALIKLRLQGAGHHDNPKSTMLESCALLKPGR